MPTAPKQFRPKGWKPPDRNQRSKEGHERGKLYNDNKWRKARKLFLQRHPLCVMCLEAGLYKEAEVIDHIIPHKGDTGLFWDVSNWQSLCKRHHDSDKQREERKLIAG